PAATISCCDSHSLRRPAIIKLRKTSSFFKSVWQHFFCAEDWTCVCESVRELVLRFVVLATADADASDSVALVRFGIGRARSGNWSWAGCSNRRVTQACWASD